MRGFETYEMNTRKKKSGSEGDGIDEKTEGNYMLPLARMLDETTFNMSHSWFISLPAPFHGIPKHPFASSFFQRIGPTVILS